MPPLVIAYICDGYNMFFVCLDRAFSFRFFSILSLATIMTTNTVNMIRMGIKGI